MNKDPGRNDPCPCGSGKKYKKCCWREHRIGRDRHRRTNEGTIRKKPTGEQQSLRWQKKLSRFRSMQVEEKFEFFRSRYRDENNVDGEYFLEMTEDLFMAAARSGRLDEFESVLENVREHRKDLVSEFGRYLGRWRILGVIWGGKPFTDRDRERLIETYTTDPDLMDQVLPALKYHGRMDVLRSVLPELVSYFRENERRYPGVHDRLARQGPYLELYHDVVHRETMPEAEEWLKSNRKRLRTYVDEINDDVFIRTIKDISGQNTRTWSPADFVITLPSVSASGFEPSGNQTGSKAGPRGHRSNYWRLATQFLRYRHVEDGVPLSRGDQCSNQIVNYLFKRADRELESEGETGKSEEERPPEQKRIAPENLLIPDGDTLDRYWDLKRSSINGQPYDMVALYTSLPAWLTYLEEQSLIVSEQVERSLDDIRPLRKDLETWIEDHWPDPLLLDHLRKINDEGEPIS